MFGRKAPWVRLAEKLALEFPNDAQMIYYAAAYGMAEPSLRFLLEKHQEKRRRTNTKFPSFRVVIPEPVEGELYEFKVSIPKMKDNTRLKCDVCHLIRHQSDSGQPCRRCGHTTFKTYPTSTTYAPHEFFDVAPKRRGGQGLVRSAEANTGVLTRCPSCLGVQPWRRKECQRCKVPVEIYKTKPNKTNAPLEIKIAELEAKVLRHEDEICRRGREIRSEKDRLNATIRQRTNEWRREKNQRKLAEARGPVDPTKMTLMGFPVDSHIEAIFVAEELARAVHKYTRGTLCNEIAERFLKLRTPPPSKKVIRLEKFVCPKCSNLVRTTGFLVQDAEFWCPNNTCNWRGNS